MPGGHLNFQPKRVSETCFPSQPFDFISSLAVGENISSATISASVYSGTDANPSALLTGAVQISGTQVQQLTTGGVLGVIYELLCKAVTSLGQTLSIAAYLAVIPDL